MNDATGPESVFGGIELGGQNGGGGGPGGMTELDAELRRIGLLVEAAPVELINLAEIRPDPNQPRTSVDEEGIRALAQSIDKAGLLNHPHVYRFDSADASGKHKLQIDSGHRRVMALILLGRTSALCKVLPAEAVANTRACDLARVLRQHAENAEAENFSRWDECSSLSRQLDALAALGLSLERGEQIEWLAGRNKLKTTGIYDRLALLESPPALREVLRLPATDPRILSWRAAAAALKDAKASRNGALEEEGLRPTAKLLGAVAAAAGVPVPSLATAEDLEAVRARPEFDRALRDHCAVRGERLAVVEKQFDSLVGAIAAWDQSCKDMMRKHLARVPGTPRPASKRKVEAKTKKSAGGSTKRQRKARAETCTSEAEDASSTTTEAGTEATSRPDPEAGPKSPRPLFKRDARGRRLEVNLKRLAEPDTADRESLLAFEMVLDELLSQVRKAVRATNAGPAGADEVL